MKLGYRRIIVFPYFLFTGVLVKRIYDIADQMAARHPEIEFLKAPYLNDHPLVLDAFVERVREILAGENVMNCQMCKYREQVIGFEAEVGRVQESHHHHVEGIGTGAVHGTHGHPRMTMMGITTTMTITMITIMRTATTITHTMITAWARSWPRARPSRP